MTDTEDDKLIERLARAACEADGYNPDEILTVTRSETWRCYEQSARGHLAMQRELARGEADDDDFDTEAFKRAVKSLPTKDTDE